MASDIIQDPRCQHLIERIKGVTSSEPQFKADLFQSVQEAMADKLAQWSVSSPSNGSALDTLAHYLIEEMAIILFLNHMADVRYPMMVVPHFIPSIVPKLYSGRHAALFTDVTGGEPFSSMKLVLA